MGKLYNIHFKNTTPRACPDAFALKDLYDSARPPVWMDLRAYQSEALVVSRASSRGARTGRSNAPARRGGRGCLGSSRTCSPSRTTAPPPVACGQGALGGDAAAETLIAEFTKQDTRSRRRSGRPPTVEVAHEALLREWPLLRDWIGLRRQALRLRDQIEAEAKAWRIQGQPAFLLWKHERWLPPGHCLKRRICSNTVERDEHIAAFLTREADRLLAELAHGSTDHIRRGGYRSPPL